MNKVLSQRLLTLTADHLAVSPSPLRIDSSTLAQIAEIFSCQWATLWLVHPDQPSLHPDMVWNLEPAKVWNLEQSTRVRTLTLSEGTAGHVWRSRKPVWTTDLAADMCLPRSLKAKEAGLKGGIWIPIKTDSAVHGVIELLGIDIPSPSEELLVSIEQFGVSIGLLMEKAAIHQPN